MDPIIARNQEIKLLSTLYDSQKPEFLAIYGRRRVGKTFLIREFFKNKGVYFSLTGLKGASLKKQLINFSSEFSGIFQETIQPKTWQEAFDHLRRALQKITTRSRIILFFDELPWLATARSEFLLDLDYLWNRYLSEDSRIILIICGSAASWMIRKVLRNKGGLHGRLTAQIRLLPFTLAETELFLQSKGVLLDRKSLLEIYMAIGGIPKYLSYIQRGQSALQTVSNLCFNGPLIDEFQELYSSLFSSHERHLQVIQSLAKHPTGLSKSQLAKKTQLSMGGGMNLILEELEQSGFIMTLEEFGKKKKDCRFKLIDEYSLFYLRWSSQAKGNSLSSYDPQFWLHMATSPSAKTWAGYAFEMICLKHLPQIKKALGIAGVLTRASGRACKETQIDLLIDRADRCINLCEIKFSSAELVIDKELDQSLREKKEQFLSHTKVKKSIFLTLISPYGIKPNVGYFGTVDLSLTMDDLFA